MQVLGVDQVLRIYGSMARRCRIARLLLQDQTEVTPEPASDEAGAR
jgi:hypothetical protein